MKRILFVLAITLILTMCFVGQAFALDRPWTEDNNDSGEDHPWGGDDASNPSPILIKSDKDVSFATGYITIDFIFRYFILDKITNMDKVYTEKQVRQIHRIEFHNYSKVSSKGIHK